MSSDPGRTLLRWTATVGPTGWLPIAPGTWGSGVACVTWWFWLSEFSLRTQLAIVVFLVPLAVWSSGVAENKLGHDAKPIVIDEVVGQWLTLLFVPFSLIWMIVAFLLFRAFDVLKPYPVRQSQKLPGGYGIVVDDILAGLYAGILSWILHRVRNG